MSFEKETFLNLVDFYCHLGINKGIKVSEIEGIPFVHNLEGKWPGYLLGGMEIDEAKMIRLSAAMIAGVCPPFWIRELTSDKTFDELALKNGIRQVNLWKGMWMEKQYQFNTAQPQDDLIFERVTGPEELKDWLKVVNSELMPNKKIDFEIFRNAQLTKNYYFFRVKSDKETLSTILVFLKDNVAGFYMLSTLASMRGKGIGRWIMTESIDYFIRNGISKFILHSTSLGYPIQKRIGFVDNCEYGIFWKVGKF
jgi:GNAT superfamily N-acetyltransferase